MHRGLTCDRMEERIDKLEFGGESPLTNCSSCSDHRFLVRGVAIWYVKYVGRGLAPADQDG